MNRLEKLTAPKQTITILRMVQTIPTFPNDVENISLTFSDGSVFMTGQEIADILADYSAKTFLYVTAPAAEFINAIEFHWLLWRDSYKKMYTALNAAYDLLNTYEKHENSINGIKRDGQENKNTQTGSEKITTTDSGGLTTTTTPTGTQKVTTTETGGYTDTQSLARAPYDSADLSTAEQVTKTHTPNSAATTATTEYTGRTDTEKLEYNKRKKEQEHSYNSVINDNLKTFSNTLSEYFNGENIGGNEITRYINDITGRNSNTPPAEWLNAEIVFRLKYSLKKLFILDFLSEYTF